MAGAAWGFNQRLDRNKPSVQFADPFLQSLLTGAVLRYLAVAHFGRGRGNWVEGEAPAFWQVEVERALGEQAALHPDLWQAVRNAPDEGAAAKLVEAVLRPATDTVLGRLYPGVALSAPAEEKTA
jgi:hypothetical protein